MKFRCTVASIRALITVNRHKILTCIDSRNRCIVQLVVPRCTSNIGFQRFLVGSIESSICRSPIPYQESSMPVPRCDHVLQNSRVSVTNETSGPCWEP